MATIYVDSTWTGSTTGAQSTPLNALSQIAAIVADGDTIALKCGSVFRETLPAAAIEKNNLRIVAYGEGARPKIMGSTRVTNWTYNATYDLYYVNLGSNVGGNVTENGVPLTFVPWTSNLATTAPLITQGGFSFDFSAYNLYVRPGYRIDDVFEASSRLYGIDGLPLSFHTGLYIEGIEIIGTSRHGIWLHNRGPVEVCDVVVRIIGGLKEPSFWLGNGIEVNRGSSGSVVRDSLIEDIFDSAISPQVYDTSPYTLLGCTVRNNTIRRCGMAGVEVSSQTATNIITGAQVLYNTMEDIGKNNWSGDRGGSGVAMFNNGGSASAIQESKVAHNTMRRCVRGYLSGRTNGSNVIAANRVEDCDAAFRTSKSSASGLSQRDVIVGNVAINCVTGYLQEGSEVQYADLRNNTFVGFSVGIDMSSNASAVVDAKNNAFKGSGTAFSVSAGTLTESYNVVDTTVTPGKTLDLTDQVLDLSRYMHDDGSLRTPYMLDDIPMMNPLGAAGTYVQGVTLRNGRAQPGRTPIGAYALGRTFVDVLGEDASLITEDYLNLLTEDGEFITEE